MTEPNERIPNALDMDRALKIRQMTDEREAYKVVAEYRTEFLQDAEKKIFDLEGERNHWKMVAENKQKALEMAWGEKDRLKAEILQEAVEREKQLIEILKKYIALPGGTRSLSAKDQKAQALIDSFNRRSAIKGE